MTLSPENRDGRTQGQTPPFPAPHLWLAVPRAFEGRGPGEWGGWGPSWHARRTSGEEEVPGRTDGRTPPQGTAASSGLSSLPCRPSRRNPSRARRAGFLEKGPRGLCHDRSPLPAPQEAAGGNAARRTLNLGLWPFSGRSSNVSQQPRRKNPPTRAWGLGVQDPRRPPPPSEAPTVTTEPFPAGGEGGGVHT